LIQKHQLPSLLDQDKSILTFLDRFIPDVILADVSERFRSRNLVLMVSILLLLALISMSMVIAVDQTLNERRLITITLISLQPISLCLMWWKKSIREASWYVVVMVAITIMYIDYNNASFQGAFSITWMLPTTITVMLLGGRAALKVTFVAILGMSLNFALLKAGLLPDPITPPKKWVNVEFIISISIMLIVTFSVYALSRMAKQKEQELSSEIESRKQIAKELEEAKDIAEQAAANKSMFLATMSHELRTPLNSILGNAELLSRQELEEKTGARVSDIHSAGQLLISIINDILDLSKFDSYGIELNEEVYDISAQLNRIHRMMETTVKPGVEFILDGVTEAIYINSDQNRISQVILNLVSNAAKFTETGSIRLSLTQQNHGLTIVVQDTGVGISDEDASNLFQDFVQVRKHANRQVEGTGLGLAIIQRIIDRMGGTITLDSIEGTGSKFIIKLPLDILTIDRAEENKKPHDSDIKDDLSSLSVLIVDDVAMNCIILKALLEELGITNITEEHDGEEAVALIKQGSEFDVILMDIRMPKMDGLEASQLIRSLAYKKHIIAVTANAFDEDRKACLESGMDDFLSKPIELDKLRGLLEGIIY
jgi:signal transduction histidine kinase/CheY-like chemotaxis protein